MDYRPLILTALPDAAAQTRFDAARRRWFPPERNVLDAHITLFHQLPGSEVDGVIGRVQTLARVTPRIAVEVTGLRSLGQGVAYALRSDALSALRADLADGFGPLLTAQDAQAWRGHVTVQNKVTSAVARATLNELSAGFEPWSFTVTGVGIWRYLGGPWEPVKMVGLRG